MNTNRFAYIALAAAVAAAGCGQENPTDVGESLLPGGVRSYEVVLPASRFLLSDTAFSGYYDARATGFLLVARDYQGTLDANIIGRLTIPTFITARDSAGNAVTDSLPSFTGGRMLVVMDSVSGNAGPDNATLRLFRLAETYHALSANWSLRVDTGTVQLPWAIVGGTPGSQISSGTWQPGTDTVVIAVDSATIAAWADTLSPVRGFVLRASDEGTRLRVSEMTLLLDAVSSIRDDTVFTATATTTEPIFVFDPQPPFTTNGLAAGGAPAWRSMLRLKERLDTLALPCIDNTPGCFVLLRDASVTAASLQFDGAPALPGFLPEDSIGLAVRDLFASPTIPIERSPLGAFAGSTRSVRPSVFTSGGVINIPIGEYIREFTDGDDIRPGPWVAVVGSPEGATFGYAAFAGPPRLRLVLSVGADLRLQ